MSTDILAVNEIFGPTIQGEGRSLGMPCMFLRLAGCNLACVWCDTPYAWDWSRYDPKVEIHPRPWLDVQNELMEAKVRNLVVTGGEPMLQQQSLGRLAISLRNQGWWIEVETAGTMAPDPCMSAVHQFNVSIKLASSGNPEVKRIRPYAIEGFAKDDRSTFKFVVTDLRDFDEIDELVVRYNLTSVYIMPEGITGAAIQEKTEQIIQAVIDRNYRLTTRLQILTYGNKRGV